MNHSIGIRKTKTIFQFFLSINPRRRASFREGVMSRWVTSGDAATWRQGNDFSVFRPSQRPSGDNTWWGRWVRAHALKLDSAARGRQRETPPAASVGRPGGGDNAGYRPTGCVFLSPRRPQPLTHRHLRELLIRAYCSPRVILVITFNRLPTSVPARSQQPSSLHNPGFFRIQVSGSTVLPRRPWNGIVRPFGTVPTGFRRARFAGRRQWTRSVEGRTTKQGNYLAVWCFSFFFFIFFQPSKHVYKKLVTVYAAKKTSHHHDICP